MTRGILPFWLWVDIAPLDVQQMATDNVYDDDWREPLKVDGNADGLGEEQRREGATITIKGNPERDRDELRRMTRGGDLADSAIGIVVRTLDLELAGQINADGSLIFKKGDRLVEIRDKRGLVVDNFTRTPLYLEHAMRLQADIGHTSNHALMLFTNRKLGA